MSSRLVALGHLERATQARAQADAEPDTLRRQELTVVEQTEALAAARLLTGDFAAQQAMLRIVYDLPGASASQKLSGMIALLSERRLPCRLDAA